MSLALQSGSYPLETQHASLKRKKEPAPMPPVLYSPVLEKNEVSIYLHYALLFALLLLDLLNYCWFIFSGHTAISLLAS